MESHPSVTRRPYRKAECLRCRTSFTSTKTPSNTRAVGLTETPSWSGKTRLLVPAATNIQIYTQYLDFTAKFVMHCHILDHEDLGMMELDNVVEDLTTPACRNHG